MRRRAACEWVLAGGLRVSGCWPPRVEGVCGTDPGRICQGRGASKGQPAVIGSSQLCSGGMAATQTRREKGRAVAARKRRGGVAGLSGQTTVPDESSSQIVEQRAAPQCRCRHRGWPLGLPFRRAGRMDSAQPRSITLTTRTGMHSRKPWVAEPRAPVGGRGGSCADPEATCQRGD